MPESEQRLKSEITEDDIAKWDEKQWRAFQFRHMVSTNVRLSALEDKISWRSLLTAIPWAILGAVTVALSKYL